jgi:hypothetical protein
MSGEYVTLLARGAVRIRSFLYAGDLETPVA